MREVYHLGRGVLFGFRVSSRVFFLGFFRVSMLLCLLIRLGFSCSRFGAAYAAMVVIVRGVLI